MTWNAAGCSVQGSSHIQRGIPCQDACAYLLKPGAAMGLVADGLGSANHAELGSALAVAAGLAVLEDIYRCSGGAFADPFLSLRFAFRRAIEVLQAQAGRCRMDLHDLGTTLIGVIWTREALAVGQIGDGAAAGMDGSGAIRMLSLPQNGEHANETIPITNPDALERAQFTLIREPMRAVALFTDGIQRQCMNLQRGEAFAPFFEPFFNALLQGGGAIASADVQRFLASERVNAATEDDKTLLLIGRREAEASERGSTGEAQAQGVR